MSAAGETASTAVRPAAHGDLAALVGLDAAASPSPFGAGHLQRYCAGAGGARALVCEAGGETAGLLLYTTVLDEGSIENIAVLPAFRRRGIGAALLAAALAAMRTAGVRRCLLEVRDSNLAARALYARYGFHQDGVRPGYYDTSAGREDALLLSRRL